MVGSARSRTHRFDVRLPRRGRYGLIDELRALSVKRQIGKELAEVMRFQKLSVHQTARQLKTTPTQIRRLLDRDNEDVKVDVLIRAAFVIGRELRISLAWTSPRQADRDVEADVQTRISVIQRFKEIFCHSPACNKSKRTSASQLSGQSDCSTALRVVRGRSARTKIFSG